MIANKQPMTLETLRKPPFSDEAETAALGAIMQHGKSNQLVREALDILTPEMFYKSSHQAIYRAMSGMQNIDPSLVADELERIGFIPTEMQWADVMGMAAASFTVANILNYAKAIKQCYNQRESIAIYHNAIEQAYNREDANEIAGNVIECLNRIDTASDYLPHHINTKIGDWIDLMEKRCSNDQSAIGVKTGISRIDDAITGIRRNWLVVLAGRPSMGKTLIAQLVMSHIAQRGEVLFFSMEMSSGEIMDRYVGLLAGVSPKDLNMGALSDDEWPRVHRVLESMREDELKLHYDETPALSVNQIAARAKATKKRYPNLSMIAVDYLGLMQMPNAEREDIALGTITRRLKQLAKEIDVPILLLAQANRGTDSARRPTMQNLKGSSGIEADADLVLFCHRDEVAYPDSVWAGTTEIIPAKFRHGSFNHSVYMTKTETGFRCLSDAEITERKTREQPNRRGGFDL